MNRGAWWIVGSLLAVPVLVFGCECSIRGGHFAAHRTWDSEVEKCFTKGMIGRSIKEASILGRGLGDERQNDEITPANTDIFDCFGDPTKAAARTASICFDHPNCDRFPESCFDEGLIFRLDKQDRILWIGRWMH